MQMEFCNRRLGGVAAVAIGAIALAAFVIPGTPAQAQINLNFGPAAAAALAAPITPPTYSPYYYAPTYPYYYGR